MGVSILRMVSKIKNHLVLTKWQLQHNFKLNYWTQSRQGFEGLRYSYAEDISAVRCNGVKRKYYDFRDYNTIKVSAWIQNNIYLFT